MPAFDSQTTGNDYSAACTIEGVWQGNGGFFSIVSADVFAQLQWGIQGGGEWTQEVHVPAGNGTLFPGTSGIRFRSYVAGQPASVSASIAPPRQPTLNIGQPSTVTLATTSITARVSGAGAILGGTGFTVTHVGTGHYRITYSTAFAAVPACLAICRNNAALIATLDASVAASCDVYTWDATVAVPVASDQEFVFTASAIQ